jgi:hypothetical protein
MNEENNAPVVPTPDLESYFHHGSLSRTISLGIVALVILAAIVWVLVVSNEPILSDEDFRAQFAFHGIDSLWVVKNTVERPDFKGILLVPQIRFQVRNESQKPLRAVQMIGIFRFLNTGRSIGESIIYLFDRATKPGQSSPEMVMMTENGYEAGSVQDFEKNRKYWEGAMVEIYAKSGRQKLTFIKSFYISRRIQGLDLDVKLVPQGEKQGGE